LAHDLCSVLPLSLTLLLLSSYSLLTLFLLSSYSLHYFKYHHYSEVNHVVVQNNVRSTYPCTSPLRQSVGWLRLPATREQGMFYYCLLRDLHKTFLNIPYSKVCLLIYCRAPRCLHFAFLFPTRSLVNTFSSLSHVPSMPS
jgi:hypothetical protein